MLEFYCFNQKTLLLNLPTFLLVMIELGSIFIEITQNINAKLRQKDTEKDVVVTDESPIFKALQWLAQFVKLGSRDIQRSGPDLSKGSRLYI